ncbi:annexin-B12-like isoform X1 [Physella acuta]|uniref:annexin-B12-like isoform X1 n=1 Tax=Physella acuta TaxID=109671 RepID=UPI0027DDB9D1|nr:annexin-B12-like isoform X1 [Physella acuta]
MSYPPYGGGYPPQQPGGYPAPGGYGGGPGYPQPGGYPPAGGMGMPTPESASAAAYGSAPGGLPYAPQPGGAPGSIGFNSGYPAQPGYQQQPASGYPAQGYNPPPPGGYGGAAPPYGQTQGSAPPPSQYGAGVGGPAPGYGAPPAAGYGAPPAQAGQYGAPASQPGGYGAPPAGGYGAPPAGGYGAPPAAGYGAPAGQPAGQYGGYGAPGQGQGQYGGAGGNYGNVPGPASYKIYEEGTLKPFPNFNVEQDVQILRKAMKGLGTDEKAIIDVLGNRSNDQRQKIKLMYKTCFGRDLVSDLKSELGGRFEDASVALMMRPDELDAYELRRAMRGAGTDEAALIEILCTRTNDQIHAITATYKLMYGRKLEDDIISETSGHFRKLLVSMSVGGRQENMPVDINKARTDAQRLYQAGEKRWGTDENTFNMILASQSYEQCRAVFDEYSRISKHDIEQAIRNEMSGDVATGMLTIIRMIRSKHGYFAERLHQSMKGLGTDDRTLIRIIVSRCEVDMKQIRDEFQKRFGQSLDAFVRGDVSGDYRMLMLALITPH